MWFFDRRGAGFFLLFRHLFGGNYHAAQAHYDRLVADLTPVVEELERIKASPERVARLFSRALSGNLETQQRAVLAAGLQEARGRLGDLVPSLNVSVTADGTAPEGWTLFVIARPPGGGMPYAVVRRPSVSLPLDLRVDDAVAMSADRPLSQAGEVELVVRLSRSGAPAAQAGDWEWRSELLDLSRLTAPRRVEAVLREPDAS